MKKICLKFFFLSFSFFLFLFTACKDEGVKLTGDDRIAIDTLSANAIKTVTPELEKQCKDSADVLRKRLVDSLVIVREQEIMMQAVPPSN